MHEKIKEYILVVEEILSFLKTYVQESEKADDSIRDLTKIRMLAKTELWPEAVPTELVCGDTYNEKIERASGILAEMITVDLFKKKFLDFGCGEGHTTFVAASSCKATGYDISEFPCWETLKKDDLKLTTNWGEIEENGPYDVILANDVLDHSTDPQVALNQIKSVTAKNGTVFLKCHPWTSRHGTHLYKQLNKAYLHLVFSSAELYGMGLIGTPAYQTSKPLEFYKKIIEEAGFKIKKEDKILIPIEQFFLLHPELFRRIKKNCSDEGSLEIQFVNYVLIP